MIFPNRFPRYFTLSKIKIALILSLSSANVIASPFVVDETSISQKIQQMTLDEKISLLSFSLKSALSLENGALGSAGFVPGIPRLSIPALQMTDASLGIANPKFNRKNDQVTAFPSTMLLAATFSPSLAEKGGKILGIEAREKGFNILLAGGADVIRDPLNGRNFEYFSEDPLLTGKMAGHAIRGIQSEGTVSTMKHFILNTMETGRVVMSADLNQEAMREVDLFAFKIAGEIGHPGAVMPGYNRVNGEWASENSFLLNEVLKHEWGFNGWVISDWGATHSTLKAVNAGLDQQAAYDLDQAHYFGEPLKKAVSKGQVTMARIDDMVKRILTSVSRISGFGARLHNNNFTITAHKLVAQNEAEEGIVLLQNRENVLPLLPHEKILVVGGYANRGVMSGGGSSQVLPEGSFEVKEPVSYDPKAPKAYYHPSSPLHALQHTQTELEVSYNDGQLTNQLKEQAAKADKVIVFATAWNSEAVDAENLSLPHHQNDLINFVAEQNKNTIVVLETGGPVLMPWISSVKGIIESWYPGGQGAEAIANILVGQVNPSGHLPVTFPQSEKQLPQFTHPAASETSAHPTTKAKSGLFGVDYNTQGVDVGYRWFEKTHQRPLYPFGYGLSYTHFSYSGLTVVSKKNTVTIHFTVSNQGSKAGKAVPQIYIDPTSQPQVTAKLAGWRKVDLASGEQKYVSLSIDPRLFARWNTTNQQWSTIPGEWNLRLGENAEDKKLEKKVSLKPSTFSDPKGI
ncbi:glycoside hydrolase family 3 C-terminal domain-containing protein [Tatumella ptyseos]|uniref:glycoside hydrolase family 3 C-terminal domain-containing protein n=1 Tax=Tatumella ptyseos TaxID=82987 RepID=UPI0026EB8103|nr:glycoside hydrolase family 3 C-terminal domain-containing protein [Tatumella ptyseos]WKX27799.1 glycoside hydrolase family 3 C-terminal domain-containing protein [Tatumella ptyseos]